MATAARPAAWAAATAAGLFASPSIRPTKLQSGLLAFFDQRLQRLLLAGIRRQTRGPTDHQAIDRRTLHDRQ
jgi:hypothetical protein